MARLLVMIFILFSFSASLFTDDSCCLDGEKETHEVSFHTDTCDQSESGEQPTDDCEACYRCGNGLGFSVRSDFSQELSLENIFEYLPSVAPSPDLLDFLRPPIV